MQPSVPDAYPRADGPTPHRRHRGAAGRHHPPYAHRRGRFAPLAGALGGAAGGARQGRQRDRHAAHDAGAGSHLAPPRGAAAGRPAGARDRARSRPDGHGDPAARRRAGGHRARSAAPRAAHAGRAGGGGRWALRTGAGGTGVQADGRWGGWADGRAAAPPDRPSARPPVRDRRAHGRHGRRPHRPGGVPDRGAGRGGRSLDGADGRRQEPHAGAAVKREATLIAGDGIGPEITEATLSVLAALGAEFDWDEQYGGMSAVEKAGTPLPKATLDSIRRTGLALKGPLTTPVGGGYRSVNGALRQAFDLYANARPVKSIVPGGRYVDVDLVIVRENTEGLYVGLDRTFKVGNDPKALAQATSVMTRDGCRRIVRYAFEYARRHGRKKVTIVHKANILKATSGLFLETAKHIAAEYQGQIASDDKIVDNAAMQLVINPAQFDVIVTTNLFGDILSDEASGLVGGLGLAPGANVGEQAAIFEAVHGSAPDIAGQGIANPAAQMLPAGVMVDPIGRVPGREPAAPRAGDGDREGQRPDQGSGGQCFDHRLRPGCGPARLAIRVPAVAKSRPASRWGSCARSARETSRERRRGSGVSWRS